MWDCSLARTVIYTAPMSFSGSIQYSTGIVGLFIVTTSGSWVPFNYFQRLGAIPILFRCPTQGTLIPSRSRE